MNPVVDFYFDDEKKWQAEIIQLRSTVLGCGLEEELKWGCPCYTFNKSNVVLIHVFKEYCALLFFKGALLQDTEGILIQQTKNVQAARQLRFTNLAQIKKLKQIIRQYVYQAIEVEKAGLKVKLKSTADYTIPGEFQKLLNKKSTLKKAFDALTPGRQRAYLFYFAQPKQSKTREARIEKSIPAILAGKGIND